MKWLLQWYKEVTRQSAIVTRLKLLIYTKNGNKALREIVEQTISTLLDRWMFYQLVYKTTDVVEPCGTIL